MEKLDVVNKQEGIFVDNAGNFVSYRPPGFKDRNATAINAFEILVNTEDDERFAQFTACFKLLFGTSTSSVLDIDHEFRVLKEMITVKKEQGDTFSFCKYIL